MSQLATGVPLRPSTPQPSGWSVGDLALGLERRDDRRVERFGEREHGGHVEAGAVADDDHRPARAGDERRARRRAPRPAARSRRSASRPPGRRGAARRRPGATCTSSGSTRWATPRSTSACLQRERHQLGVVGACRARSARTPPTSANAAVEVDVLERAAPERPSTAPGPRCASTGARSTLAS